MNFVLKSVVVVAVAALAACAPATQSSTTAVDPFIGKRLVSANGDLFLFNADGTVGGSLRGQPIVGDYTADAAEICSTYTSPDFLVGLEYCSTPEIADGSVLFNRRDGSKSQTYKIEG